MNLPRTDHRDGKDARQCNVKILKVYRLAMSPPRVAVEPHVPMLALTTQPSSLPWSRTHLVQHRLQAMMCQESI